jgi:hypothetical protein
LPGDILVAACCVLNVRLFHLFSRLDRYHHHHHRVNSPDAENKNRTVHGQPSVRLEGRTYAALRTFQRATLSVFMSTDQDRIY